MSNPSPTVIAGFGSGEIVKQLQIGDMSIKDKSDPKVGLSLASYIDSTVTAGVGNGYMFNRNSRFALNRSYANGRINTTRFMDQLDFNGKNNYININWAPIQLCNRIVSGLVGKWMDRDERVQVNCIDTLSLTQKNDEYENLEFIVANKQKLEALQQQSGLQLVPQTPIPADQEELNLMFHQYHRLPTEILFETGMNDSLTAMGWYDVLKRQSLHDLAETGLAGTFTWMDDQGVVHVDRVKPENIFYSYSNYPDFRDTTWRGQVKSMKISEIRRKYGVQFGGTITEEQMFQIAATAKEYKLYDNLRWLNDWNFTYLRPYDEWNVDVIDFEFKSDEVEGYTVVTTKGNKSTILKKGPRPNTLGDNEEYLEDKTWNIYRGVYVRATQMMLEWGLKKNMIRPQDPKELGDCEFSYSFYMYQNFDMRNIAIPEKIQEPLDQMIITRYKIQQCVAKAKPPGVSVNWDALQNIDYGLGDGNKEIDVKKLFDQTGDLYYRGRDAEGNAVPVPITEIPNTGFAPQLQALMENYRFHYQVLKDELGEDPNLITQALQPRVTSGNVDAAQRSAENATDYIYHAFVEMMNDTGRKMACLMKNSVMFGSKVYQDLVGEKDEIDKRVFSTNIQLLPTAFDLQQFNQDLNTMMAANPALSMYLDPYQLRRIAKQDVKLADLYMRNAQKKMYVGEMQKAQANSQQQADVQMQAAQAAEQGKQQTEQMKSGFELQKVKIQGEEQSKVAMITLMGTAYAEMQKTGAQIPSELMPVFQVLLQNVVVPMVIENKQLQGVVQQQIQEAYQNKKDQPPVPGQEQPENQEQPEQQQPMQEDQQSQPVAA